VESRNVKIGIVGTHAKCEMGDKWYLLGGRKEEAVSIHVLGVGSATKVATREVDKIIGSYTEDQIKSSVLEAREEDGYSFLTVHLPSHTLEFNQTLAQKVGIEQAWTLKKTDVNTNIQWRAKHGAFDPRLGKWVYGDKFNSNIGILDETVATHYGVVVECMLSTPFIDLESMSIDELKIETIPGHTGTKNATVAISLSYDGVTLGKEWWAMYGDPGAYGQRFVINRLGYIRNWVTITFRMASFSRMAFSRALISYG